MAYFYHLKSNFFSKKCIFFISDTDTGAKKYDRYRRVRRCRMLSDLIDDVEKKLTTQKRNRQYRKETGRQAGERKKKNAFRLTNGGSWSRV